MLYWLYLPDEEAANGLAQELGLYSLVVVVSRPSANQKDWVLVVEGKREFGLTLARGILERLADEYGGYYDGWEADAMPKKEYEEVMERLKEEGFYRGR